MASSRQLMSGKHLTSIVLTLQTIAANGTLSNSTQYTLTQRSTYVGWVEDVSFESDTEVEDGTVMGSPSANDAPTVQRNMMTLTEPLRYVNTGNLLAGAFYNSVSNADGTTGTPYAKIAITRAGKVFTFYVLMKSYREEYRKGKCVGVMACSMIDAGVANPSYASA